MKEMWMETLGKRMKKVIYQYKYPPLKPDIFTPEVCAQWRTILSGLPKSEESLKQLLTYRLLKSTIEEIEDIDDHLIFHLSMIHKGERYAVRVKLQDLKWSIESIQFVDQAGYSRLFKGISLLVAFLLLLCAGYVAQNWWDKTSKDQGKVEQTEAVDVQQRNQWNETMFLTHLSEIEAAARDHGYFLIKKEDFEKEIEKRITDALANVPQQETSASEENKPVSITIKPGSSSGDIVKLLAEKNVIKDEREAIQLLRALGLENKIRAGTYQIRTDATYMEIFNTITK